MLAADRGGPRSAEGGGPLLVLLHGLGATRQVWAPMLADIDRHWSGRWIAVDMPGHGASPRQLSYLPGAQAAAVADLIRAEGIDGDVVLFGHSMGGTISLALASGYFGVMPKAVLAVGTKMAWSEAELGAMAAQAAKPAKLFEDRDAAVERYLKVSGLFGLVDPASGMAASGVVADGDGWRMALDPRTNEIGPPILPGMVESAVCPLHFAAGSEDAMCRIEDLRRWDPQATGLPGLSHNAMVQDPAAVWAWAGPCLAAVT
jgi:pimeloyl-ACP methyl ester carboxylesterase